MPAREPSDVFAKEFMDKIDDDLETDVLVKEKSMGYISENWDQDAKFCERIPNTEPALEIKNPNLIGRLGTKRKVEEIDGEDDVIENYRGDQKPNRKLADERYNQNDLRNVLGITNQRTYMDELLVEPEVIDLGSRLKNRTKNMVFMVERPMPDPELYDHREIAPVLDIRPLIERRRAQSPLTRRHISPINWSIRRSSSEHRRRSPKRFRSPLRRISSRRLKKSPEGTLYSDKMYLNDNRHRKRRNSDYSEEEPYNSSKPRSKVAVVIKTQKRPAVASTIWSRVEKDSGSSSFFNSEKIVIKVERPGFRASSRQLTESDYKSPPKITMTNDRLKVRR
ncbi:hypothetical protein NQ317_006524 [Molorchus minor]|uniref:Uncharacterized protein n=1 Tax=Molorchus minor TaxID=1323400 RepID=A0ABQ9IX47_9CUCU|nr:hypothetical protein NQ317_006524 [Molorchus minor]